MSRLYDKRELSIVLSDEFENLVCVISDAGDNTVLDLVKKWATEFLNDWGVEK